MKLLAEMLSNFIQIHSEKKDTRSDHVFYKIVDSNRADQFTLQCRNTSALFYANITDIVFDTDILHGLHPIQSCFIGIEYTKKHRSHSKMRKINYEKIKQHRLNRYGEYSLYYQNRIGELCFISNTTNEQFVMDPRDIALSEELITEFDAAQAFYIGLLAGLKINTITQKNVEYPRTQRPNLYLIK